MRTTTALLVAAICAAAAFPACESGETRVNGGDADADGDANADTDTGTDDEDACSPGEVWCFNGWVSQCDDAGNWVQQTDCAELGLVCAAGECVDISEQCAAAINEKSYIGCEYFATTLSNSNLNYGLPENTFTYAIAIANNGGDQADVHIDDGPGGAISNDYAVPAGSMITIEDLPWKLGVKDAYTGSFPTPTYATRKVANAVYRVTSTRPVTAYQFSALHYTAAGYYSYTNDASLLLPAHVYRDEYVAMSRPTFKLDFYGDGSTWGVQPGFIAILGHDEGTTTVEIRSSAYTLASDASSNASYAPLAPGGTMTAEIGPYEVLQILTGAEPGSTCTGSSICSYSYCCNTPATYDLTGTTITVTSGPNPAVFAGHDCTFVPFNKWACDHLEEQMFPLETWGTHYLCAHNVTQAAAEPSVWRVLSGTDGNEIAFSPPSVHAGVTLDKGEFVEFESLADFEVVGDGRVAVSQFMVGQNYTSDTTPPLNGDPAMALAVPVEQYRTQYTFLAPTSYVYNYLTVLHQTGAFPLLDGTPIAGETVAITADWSRTNLTITGGVHDISSDVPFGIAVYGVGSYTSYMYPGRLDLKEDEVIVE